MKETIKEILSTYRPGTSDDDDPVMQKALTAVEKDPELLAWFSRQLEMDNTIRASLNKADAPDDLLDKVVEFGNDFRPKRNWRATWMPLAIAVCFVFLGLFAFKDTIINNQILGYHPSLSVVEKQPDFRSAMGTWVKTTMINLDFFSEDHNELNSWLGDRGFVQFEGIPEGLEKLRSLGCKSFKWQDQQVSLVCFTRWRAKSYTCSCLRVWMRLLTQTWKR
jgi:hypothetical protein